MNIRSRIRRVVPNFLAINQKLATAKEEGHRAVAFPFSARHGHSGALYASDDGLVGDDTPLVASAKVMLVKTTVTTPTT